MVLVPVGGTMVVVEAVLVYLASASTTGPVLGAVVAGIFTLLNTVLMRMLLRDEVKRARKRRRLHRKKAQPPKRDG